MSTNDRETVVVSNSGGGSAGWFIAGLIVAGLLVAGLFVYNGGFGLLGNGDNKSTIELKLPDAPAPAKPSN